MSQLPKINTPSYTLTLPSGPTIAYRPFVVKERAVLQLSLEEGEPETIQRAVATLINACTFGKCDMMQMPMVDVEWLFMHIRAKSVGEDLSIVHSCSCGNKTELKLSTNDAKIVGSNALDMVKITDDLYLKFHLPKSAEIEEFALDGDEHKIRGVAMLTDLILHGEQVYECKDLPLAEVEEFIGNFTEQQFEAINSFLENIPKIELTHEYVCKKCEAQNKVVLEGIYDFFG